MKKYTFLLFIIIYLCCILFAIPKVYGMEVYYPTKEEIGGEIQIPNREGSYDCYTDINTYEELYSVLEDLSIEYSKLLEEYNSMEGNYQEKLRDKNIKIEDLNDEIEYQKVKAKNSDNNIIIIIMTIIIVGIVILYNYSKE